MPRVEYEYIANVYAAMKSTNYPVGCTSRVFAAICMKLADYYSTLYHHRYVKAKQDYRIPTEDVEELRRIYLDWVDAASNWREKYYELSDIRGVHSLSERRRVRKNNATFERLLFKHWDSTTGCWTFGNYTFG